MSRLRLQTGLVDVQLLSTKENHKYAPLITSENERRDKCKSAVVHDSMLHNIEDTTLLQKWRTHWNTRDRILNPPPQTANKMGVTLFWASNITLMYTTLYVTAAHNDDVAFGLSCYWWRLIAWFLWFQTSYNWFLTSLKVHQHCGFIV